jgi:hypothetical protein
MELVRYKPGEAMRWLEVGASDMRKSVQRQSRSLVRREGDRNIGTDIKQAAGAIVTIGKSAIAELLHRQSMASEYVLHPEHFEIVRPGGAKSVRYDEVKGVRMRGDRASLILEQGAVHIKPHAYIVAGRVRVPIGWSRNGTEVPFELLIEELSARCRHEIEHVA